MTISDALEMFGRTGKPHTTIVVDDGSSEITYFIGDCDPPEYDPQCVEVFMSVKVDDEPVQLDPRDHPGWIGTW